MLITQYTSVRTFVNLIDATKPEDFDLGRVTPAESGHIEIPQNYFSGLGV